MRLGITLLAIALLASGTANAATGKRSARPAKKPTVTQQLSAAIAANSVDPAGNLAAACARSNLPALASALERNQTWLNSQQGDEEPYEEFEARRDKTQQVLGKYQVPVCEPLRGQDTVAAYDEAGGAIVGSFGNYRTVRHAEKDLGLRRTRTVMNVPFSVRTFIELDINASLEIHTDEMTCLKPVGRRLSFTIPLEKAAAQTWLKTATLVVIGSLTRPYVSTDTSTTTATIHEPTEVVTDTKAVYLSVNRVAIIDPVGAVLWSCSRKPKFGS